MNKNIEVVQVTVDTFTSFSRKELTQDVYGSAIENIGCKVQPIIQLSVNIRVVVNFKIPSIQPGQRLVHY